ncbi:MAG: hypothetical protein KKH92_01425 [Firmicutes bacterium]|nr:hypothetical protein [Bacillota bacterium]
MTSTEIEQKLSEIRELMLYYESKQNSIYLIFKLGRLLLRIIFTFPIAIILAIVGWTIKIKANNRRKKAVSLATLVLKSLIVEHEIRDLAYIYEEILPGHFSLPIIMKLLNEDIDFKMYKLDNTKTVIILNEDSNDLADISKATIEEESTESNFNQNNEDYQLDSIVRNYIRVRAENEVFLTRPTANIKKAINLTKELQISINSAILYFIVDKKTQSVHDLVTCMNDMEIWMFNGYGHNFIWNTKNMTKRINNLIKKRILNNCTIDESMIIYSSE